MTSETHRITNRTQGSLLSEGVHAVDATFEHLTVLRVLIEGLADNNEAGLWLTDLRSIPSVPRISPFDLIYVDRQQRVVEAVELLPAGEQPAFAAPAVSALVLPFQTISASGTRVGDQLLIDEAGNAAGAAAAGAWQAAEQPVAHVAETMAPAPNEIRTLAHAMPQILQEAIARSEREAAMDASAAALPAETAAPVMTVPLPPVIETPAPVPVAAAPAAQVLTVHEVLLPEEVRPAEAKPAEAKPRREPRGKKQKKPRTRKERRQAAVAQRNSDAAAAARQRREREAVPVQAAATTQARGQGRVIVPLPPVPAPPPVLRAAAARVAVVARAAAAAVRPEQQQGSQGTQAKFGLEKGKIMAIVSRVLHWLNPNAVNDELRSSIRRPARELVAYVGEKGAERKLEVGNISSSGLYVRTDERWEPGTEVLLNLQQNGPMTDLPDRHVEVAASTVWHGKDGMGLKFKLPQPVELDLWETAATGETSQTGPEYIVYEMRVAQALGVVRSVCPQAVEQFRTMLRKDFSSVRVRDAICIAQMADRMMGSGAWLNGLTAPAALVLRIMEMGSWASDEWTQRLWAGLLVSSCTREGNDHSNAELVETLCQLATVHLRILELASRKYVEAVAGGATQAPPITLHEMTKLLDLTNLTKTLRSVGELADRGLMTPVKRAPNDVQDENAWTTITPRGLQMVARCQGRRNSLAG